jgi:outer membrane protein insertion porin family/translocation and assembly module TamA
LLHPREIMWKRGRGPSATLLLTRAAMGIAGASSCACASIPPGRAAVDAVDFEGTSHVDEHDLRSKLATAPSPKFLGVVPGLVYDYELFDPYVLRRDLERVERYYRARGYYEAHARAGRIETVASKHVRVEIAVEEGPPVRVGEVHIEGIESLSASLRRALGRVVVRSGIARGSVFDEDDFSAAEWRIRRALENAAYAYAKVERHAAVDLPNHVATVTFDVIPDLPATFGEVAIHGLGSLPEDPVRRALDIQPGERFTANALDAAQQALLDLGVFSSVAIRTHRSDPPPPDRVVPVDVDVTTTKLRTVRVGVGAELDIIKTDLHATVGWTNQNFLGGMRRFEADVQPGIVLYPTRLPELQAPGRFLAQERFRTQLRQPGLLEARTDGYVRGAFNVYPLLITPNVDPAAPVVGYREARGTIGANRTLWKLYADLSYNLQFNSPFAYVGTEDPDLQTVLVSYVDFLTQLDFRDDRVRPHKGFYLANELQFAGGVLGGSAEDFRVQPQARAYLPLGSATFALRATTGLLFPGNYADSLELAPPGEAPAGVDRATWIRDIQLVYFRGFFSGGASSNRGYPVYGVGPHGPVPFFTPSIAVRQIRSECVPGTSTYTATRCALPLGGLTLWETSAEVRYPLSSQIESAAFCDASDVQVGRATYRPDQPHLSCGVGVRYQTPAGPIRLDVAYRIPRLNPVPGDPDYPGDIFGIPLGVAFGIGEAY